jgi:hypothetical protein
VICADELGPVIPRSFPPAHGWTADGHRVKAPLDYGRGPEQTWVYGALRVADGQAITLTAPSRNSTGYQQLLAAVETANPAGTIVVITDNPSPATPAPAPHVAPGSSPHPAHLHPQRGLLAQLPGRLVAAVSPPSLCRAVLRHPGEITQATRVATCRLNAAPADGCGAAQRRPHATDATPSPTASKERSTSPFGPIDLHDPTGRD